MTVGEPGPRAQVLVEALARAVLDGVRTSRDPESSDATPPGSEGEPVRIRVDLGLIPVFADERPLQGLAGLMDWRRSGRLSSLVRSGFCTGAAGERVLMPGNAGLPVERLVLVGLGPRSEFDAEAARRVAGDLVTTATGLRAGRVLVALPSHAERRPAELLFAALTDAIGQADRDRVQPKTDPPAEAASETELPAESAVVETEPSEPVFEPVSEAGSDSDPREPEPVAPEPPLHWWVVADERVVARLRRVLSGPPRATSGGLHT